jgi:hypothetical protein
MKEPEYSAEDQSIREKGIKRADLAWTTKRGSESYQCKIKVVDLNQREQVKVNKPCF